MFFKGIEIQDLIVNTQSNTSGVLTIVSASCKYDVLLMRRRYKTLYTGPLISTPNNR